MKVGDTCLSDLLLVSTRTSSASNLAEEEEIERKRGAYTDEMTNEKNADKQIN